ncbi:MAG: nucleotidyltransferase domain-containing protein [Candidatus Zixiibacteriota bacterium]
MEKNRDDIQSIIDELKRELQRIYRDRLKGVVLYGSYARGEATEDSDIDILVVVDGVDNPFTESRRFAEIVWRLSLENDIVILAMAVDFHKFERSELPALALAREEGVKL